MILQAPEKKDFQGIHIVGIPNKRFDISIRHGKFQSVKESGEWDGAVNGNEAGQRNEAVNGNEASERIEAKTGEEREEQDGELWISPGLIDLHTHLAWTDFDHADQLKRDPQEIEAMQAKAFEATLRAGITTARDAGGLAQPTADHILRHYGLPLRVITSNGMFGAADARGIEHLQVRMNEVFASGADWIKIMATGGLGAPTEKVLEPNFSEQEFAFIVKYAHDHGKKVLVHSWGGVTIDWSIQAGVASVEHGMFLTADQAGRMAAADVAYVPTTSIYRIAADPKGVLALPPLISDRAARAAEAHPRAVEYAKREGVLIGFGTDYATPALHGSNLMELGTLREYGLSWEEAWQSATSNAARILDAERQLGAVVEGLLADAVVFRQDPFQAESSRQIQDSIAMVLTAREGSLL